MGDLDRFDSASYSTDEVDFEDEGALGQAKEAIGPVVEKAKAHAKQAAIAVAALVVVGVLYYFFIGSLVPVTITVKDTEGRLLANSSLKIFAEGSAQVVFEGAGSSTYSVSLRAGKYDYEASSEGYAVKKSSLEISPESGNVSVKVSKDIDAEILGFAQAFPKSVYAGGTTQFSVQLKNNSSKTASIRLLGEGDLEGMVLSELISVPPKSTQTAMVSVYVPEGTTVSDQKKGDSKKGGLRIEYTEEKQEAGFTLYPNPVPKIGLSDASFSAKAIQNQNKDEDTIKVENDNQFPIENLSLSVEITSAPKNGADEVRSWFQFTEIANQPNPYEIQISGIPAKSDSEKKLQVVVPLTAEKELGITGNIVLNAPYFKEPIKRPLTLDVKEASEHKIELSLSPGSPYSIEWDEAQGRYEDKLVNLRVKNAGQIDLQEIVFSVTNQMICTTNWLGLVDTAIESLSAGEIRELKLKVSAPLAMRGNESTMYCNLHYRYDNPLASGAYVEDTETSFIQIEPKPG